MSRPCPGTPSVHRSDGLLSGVLAVDPGAGIGGELRGDGVTSRAALAYPGYAVVMRAARRETGRAIRRQGGAEEPL